MFLSVFELFKVGIGPSSSHTVGPMVAARRFLRTLEAAGLFAAIANIHIDIYGSLALTGLGHAIDSALLLGLAGYEPDTVDPEAIAAIVARIRTENTLDLLQKKSVSFTEATDVTLRADELLPHHTNGLKFRAFDDNGALISRDNYYSIGGGFVVSESEMAKNTPDKIQPSVPYPFDCSRDLVATCGRVGLTIAEIMSANEGALMAEQDLSSGLAKIWHTMESCIDRGCHARGVLPGGLKVERRAARLYQDLCSSQERQLRDPAVILDWINLWALAVNEENAVGGRVVTAPTNGAAGIIPAVLRYFDRFYNRRGDEGIYDFLLTAAAIGGLYKKNASISGAEVGCQGEVGVACSMAAAALTAVMGGTVAQVENAAEIAMEHNLGLTCDPVGGLVQIPSPATTILKPFIYQHVNSSQNIMVPRWYTLVIHLCETVSWQQASF